jgi:hypothetical protein
MLSYPAACTALQSETDLLKRRKLFEDCKKQREENLRKAQESLQERAKKRGLEVNQLKTVASKPPSDPGPCARLSSASDLGERRRLFQQCKTERDKQLAERRSELEKRAKTLGVDLNRVMEHGK